MFTARVNCGSDFSSVLVYFDVTEGLHEVEVSKTLKFPELRQLLRKANRNCDCNLLLRHELAAYLRPAERLIYEQKLAYNFMRQVAGGLVHLLR